MYPNFSRAFCGIHHEQLQVLQKLGLLNIGYAKIHLIREISCIKPCLALSNSSLLEKSRFDPALLKILVLDQRC